MTHQEFKQRALIYLLAIKQLLSQQDYKKTTMAVKSESVRKIDYMDERKELMFWSSNESPSFNIRLKIL